ncbi:hypothetical protein DPEC_G00292900 [Dallia pectoralis]|uniref:Uncharacterized protein n=1 Tax=Dallia pectoralis TaxID=75939 RepID=A0ACC2FI23_DALPE|nr:hypothetical protein DPEC_G00292900 [Dallia pectoralis]
MRRVNYSHVECSADRGSPLVRSGSAPRNINPCRARPGTNPTHATLVPTSLRAIPAENADAGVTGRRETDSSLSVNTPLLSVTPPPMRMHLGEHIVTIPLKIHLTS